MTDKLASKRAKIDRLDKRIVKLLSDRFTTAMELSELKKSVYDPKREAVVLKLTDDRTTDRKLKPATRAVYLEIMKQSRRLQRTVRTIKGKS